MKALNSIPVLRVLVSVIFAACLSGQASASLALSAAPSRNDLVLFDGTNAADILFEANENRAVGRAANDLAADFGRVTGIRPAVKNPSTTPDGNARIIVGTIGDSKIIDRLAAEGKLKTNGVTGQWESYVLQVVERPFPDVARALVIAGSDRRGTIFGIYTLSEMIGVSPWYWWADVPVKHSNLLALQGDLIKQDPPAVKYRGIFLNDEDFCLRPWASNTFDPATGNIGPKTYAKIFELLLRLRANCLWPAMHPGTAAFNSFVTNRQIADAHGIVMGSSHCEQMLRDNVSEWDEAQFGDYNFVTNPGGVLKYWEQRVRENGKFENIYTLGMRGVHDGGMPGGGTALEKSKRLHEIIRDQREMLARLVNPNITAVPQIFCPYKEVLDLYQLAPEIPDDVTLVWPDDNYGYIREFCNARERARPGGAGVYYHVSYWGRPRDYLWLCSTPPALIAEEMTKAYDYGANKLWMLNVGDLKPAELDIEFFLKLAWQPHAWNGTNTYVLLQQQLARDFGATNAPQITAIMAEYYRLNFQRKPEHMGFPTNNLFTADEASERLSAWKKLSAEVDDVSHQLPTEAADTFFELVAYPVKAAAAMNRKCLAASAEADAEIHQLTDIYNQQTACGKWRYMMSDNPRGLVDLDLPQSAPTKSIGSTSQHFPLSPKAVPASLEFTERHQQIVMQAAHATKFISGQDAHWAAVTGLGYQGEAVAVFPTTAKTRLSPATISTESPCLNYRIQFATVGNWQFTVRALPTFSAEAGQPQRYAISLDDAPPKIVPLPRADSEDDSVWQQNVLRNAALTSSVIAVPSAGWHTLKIRMVDPGIVLDAIAGEHGGAKPPGYVWPDETIWSLPPQR